MPSRRHSSAMRILAAQAFQDNADLLLRTEYCLRVCAADLTDMLLGR